LLVLLFSVGVEGTEGVEVTEGVEGTVVRRENRAPLRGQRAL
jgi:hypothetical protein